MPRLLVLTDRAATGTPVLDVVARAVDGGARAVVLRERDLLEADRTRLADQLRSLLAPVDGLLIMAGPGAGAVHLAVADPLPDPRPTLVGRSCHDADEVARAGAERCDWVTLSPWGPTASKPGYGPALGAAGFAALAAHAPPTFALGGIGPGEVAACLDAGAYGVAVMGAVMRAADPARVVADLLATLPD